MHCICRSYIKGNSAHQALKLDTEKGPMSKLKPLVGKNLRDALRSSVHSHEIDKPPVNHFSDIEKPRYVGTIQRILQIRSKKITLKHK